MINYQIDTPGMDEFMANKARYHRWQSRKKTHQEDDEQAARIIALAIHRKGIKGRHFMEQGIKKSIRVIQDLADN